MHISSMADIACVEKPIVKTNKMYGFESSGTPIWDESDSVAIVPTRTYSLLLAYFCFYRVVQHITYATHTH